MVNSSIFFLALIFYDLLWSVITQMLVHMAYNKLSQVSTVKSDQFVTNLFLKNCVSRLKLLDTFRGQGHSGPIFSLIFSFECLMSPMASRGILKGKNRITDSNFKFEKIVENQ